MWEGVTYVDPSRRPVIHEGFHPVQALVTNAGPAAVDLCVWNERPHDSKGEPTFKMFMPPGNTRSVSGSMIAVSVPEKQPFPGPPFAAIAWTVR